MGRRKQLEPVASWEELDIRIRGMSDFLRGIYTIISELHRSSKPDFFNITVDKIADHAGIGKNSVNGALSILIKNGIVRTEQRYSSGKNVLFIVSYEHDLSKDWGERVDAITRIRTKLEAMDTGMLIDLILARSTTAQLEELL